MKTKTYKKDGYVVSMKERGPDQFNVATTYPHLIGYSLLPEKLALRRYNQFVRKLNKRKP